MASTYVNNLRLNEMATGDASGTWGTTTNTNLEIIGQAVAWGTRAVANASTDNITIADGALDADRCLGLKLTGGGQACTITLLPNTSSKTWFMYNATAAALTFTCGSGANVIIPAGQTKVIATDGLGSGGVVHDLLTEVNFAGDVFVTNTLNVAGDTAAGDDAAIGYTAAEGLILTGQGSTNDITIKNDADADVIEIPTGTTGVTMAGTLGVAGVVTANAGVVVDNITIDGTQIDLSSGDLTVDVAGDIILDADGGDIFFSDAGTATGKIRIADADLQIRSLISDEDITFEGNDGGSIIEAMRLDMSEAGSASFNHDIQMVDNGLLRMGAGGDLILMSDGTNASIFANEGTLTLDGASNIILDAVGHISTPTAGTNNVKLGVNAGNSITSGGNYNTLIGDEAGTALTTGDNNVAIGFQALDAEDAHGGNVAIGRSALSTLNAGADGFNTAVGHLAGDLMSTGVQNTLIGAKAGDALSTSTSNVAIGYEALSTEDTHSLNTAVGYQALKTLNAGADGYNVAVGYRAGTAMTTGIYNTILGGDAGRLITSGARNIAIGLQALDANTIGSKSIAIGVNALGTQEPATAVDMHNIAIGESAGESITTGVQNTIIGGLAGDALTTGKQNVAIGYLALSSDDVGQKSVAIGEGALFTQNYATATDSLNTAVGYNVGNAVTTGTNNTFVGANAGDATDDGSSNTAVGSSALSANCGDNNVAVGYSALAVTTGANNVAGAHGLRAQRRG